MLRDALLSHVRALSLLVDDFLMKRGGLDGRAEKLVSPERFVGADISRAHPCEEPTGGSF